MKISPYIYPGLPKAYQLKGGIERLESISELIGARYGVTVTQMRERSRKREVCLPRQLAMYFAINKTTLKLGQIGKYFGDRDHSTVLYAKDTILDLRFTNKAFDKSVAILEGEL